MRTAACLRSGRTLHTKPYCPNTADAVPADRQFRQASGAAGGSALYNNRKAVIINELMALRIFPPDGRKTHMANYTITPSGLWYNNCFAVIIRELMRRRAFPRIARKRRCAIIPQILRICGIMKADIRYVF